MVTFLNNETNGFVLVQFEKPLVSVSYGNLVWNLVLINLAYKKLYIKYGFDKVTYQISKACAI